MDKTVLIKIHPFRGVRLASVHHDRSRLNQALGILFHLKIGAVSVIFVILQGDNWQVASLAQAGDLIDQPAIIAARCGAGPVLCGPGVGRPGQVAAQESDLIAVVLDF